MKRWMKRLGLGAGILFIGAAGSALLLLRASLPQTTGDLVLPGLEHSVRVMRDSHGIPSIQAANRHDLYMALGFVHAQDRLFQMDMQRRIGAGRLSEVVGNTALATDKFMRTLGLYRHAAASVNAASPEFRAVLDAYSAGINAFLHGGKTLPIEFTVLRYRPDDWSAADTLVLGKVLEFQHSGNYRQELLHARMAQLIPNDEIGELFPDYPKDAPVTLKQLAALGNAPLGALLAALPDDRGPQRASNNWVVDGAHSVTGKPLLANDPHLEFGVPLIWYLVRLEAPDLDITGATIPGAPVVLLGHNSRIAWGFTTTNADVEDLFVEQVDATDSRRYATPQGTAAFDARDELIMIKGRAPETLAVRETRHGPVISDVATNLPPGPANTALALQASFLNDDDQTVEAIWRIGLAQDWAGWLDALRLFTAPAQNMVYGDRDGNIGFIMPGHIPIRKSGDGQVPVEGASGGHDWAGFIPFDQLPQTYNPPAGHLATANNKIVPDDYPFLITHDWDAPYRIRRIEAGLAATPQQSIASSTILQQDIVSLAAKDLLPLILMAEPTAPRERMAMALLRHWDDRMDQERPEPLIFAAWVRAINRRLFQPRLGDIYSRYWLPSARATQNILQNDPKWCGDEGCRRLAAAALRDALDDLADRYGPAMERWRWGDAHRASFEHPIFSHFPLLGVVFDRHTPADGAADTVNAGRFYANRDEAPFADWHGPGLRAVYDLADPDNSIFQLALGQSAHVLSPHYDDMQTLWRRFEGIHIVREPAGDTLTLLP